MAKNNHMRFKIYRQLESIDCGPTCVRMISAYHGKKHSLQSIKEKCNFSRLGVTVADINLFLNELGFDVAVAKGNLEQLQKVPIPVILHWRQNHFVVLYKIKKTKKGRVYYIADPAFGKVKQNEKEFIAQWLGANSSGIVIMSKPAEEFYEKEEIKEESTLPILKNLLVNYSNHKSKIFLSILFLALAVFCNWMMPIIFQKIIDNGVLQQNMHTVYKLILVQLSFFIGYILSNNISSLILVKINFDTSVKYLTELLHKIIRLPIKYFDTRLNTDFIQRLDDQERLQSFLTFRVIDIFFTSINLIVFSAILAYYNLLVFFIFTLISSLSIIWTVILLKRRKYLDYSRFSAQSENKNNIYELINGMFEIKINNAKDKRIAVWEKTQRKINGISLKALYLNYYQLIGSSFLNRIRDILITTLCAYLVISNQMTLGIMMTISYVLGQLTGPINDLTSFSQNFQDARISLDRLAEIQRKEDETHERLTQIKAFDDRIVLSNISFKYEGSFNKFVINDLSLEIPKGKITAIVGDSGSGKTTILKLLLGFYYPQQGDILVGNNKLKDINIDNWRNYCGVVMQEGYIFSGSVLDNIALAIEDTDIERVRFAAEVACISNFIETLPNKYDTQIGKSGLELSGGQKQRLLIARAVYKNPEIILFDEATSHLDSNNESKIMSNLQSFFVGKTVVIVAHRLSTVVNADNIVYIEDGHILEQGNHKDLWNSKKHYYNLIKNQLELNV